MMGINERNLRELVIEPTCRRMGSSYNSGEAINLLLLTAAAESDMGYYLKQGYRKLDDHGGIASGLYQCESGSHDHVVKKFKWSNTDLPEEYYKGCRSYNPGSFNIENMDSDRMVWDLRYAAVIARAHYYMRPGAIPSDLDDIAMYYAKNWWIGNNATEADYEAKAAKAKSAYTKYVLED